MGYWQCLHYCTTVIIPSQCVGLQWCTPSYSHPWELGIYPLCTFPKLNYFYCLWTQKSRQTMIFSTSVMPRWWGFLPHSLWANQKCFKLQERMETLLSYGKCQFKVFRQFCKSPWFSWRFAVLHQLQAEKSMKIHFWSLHKYSWAKYGPNVFVIPWLYL